MNVALGLFTVRDLYQEDFAACMQQASAIGYKGVECFGAPSLPAEMVAKATADHGLTLVGWHVPIELLSGDAFDETVAYLKAVGCPRAVVPWEAPETFTDRDATIAFAQKLESIRQRLLPHAITLGYHNHEAEFAPLADGTLPWTLIMESCGCFGQLDVGNAVASVTEGLSVVDTISQWPGRAETVHLKPYAKATGFAAMIGRDDIPWQTFLQAAKDTGGCQWFITEYEADDLTQWEGAKACIDALSNFSV